MGVDRKNRTITLSIKAKDAAEEQAAIQTYSRDARLERLPWAIPLGTCSNSKWKINNRNGLTFHLFILI